MLKAEKTYKKLIPYLLAIALFAATFFISFHLIDYWQLQPDEGIPIYSAKRILDGQIMYRDFFDIVTPLTDYILASLYWLFGPTLRVARLSVILSNALSVVVLLFISFRIVKNKWLALIPAVIMIGYAGNHYSVSHHWFAFDAVVLTFWVILKCTEDNPYHSYIWLCPGLSVAIVFLIIQSTGLALMGMLSLFILWLYRYNGLSFKQAVRALSFFITAFLSPILFVFLLFYLAGASKAMIYDLFIWPWGHYGMTNSASYVKNIFYYATNYSPIEFLMHIFADYVSVFIAIAVGSGSLVKGLNPAKEVNIYNQRLMVLATILISAFVSTMVNPTEYRFFIFIPLDVLLIIMLVEKSLINRKLLKGLFYIYLFTFSFIILFDSMKYYLGVDKFIHSSFNIKIQTKAGEVMFPKLPAQYLIKFRQPAPLSLITALNYQFPKYTFIMYWSPMIYFLSGSTNPTILNTYIPCYNTGEQADTVIRQLEQSKPPLVIVDDDLLALKSQHYKNINPCVFDREHDILLQWIIKHYTFQTSVPWFSIYILSK
jgi:hypothetical protein